MEKLHATFAGPRDLVVDFFEHMGFRCPERKGVADFLQEVTSIKDQEQYWHDKSKPYQFVSVRDFGDAYPKWHVGEKLVEELGTPFDRSTSHPAALVHERYALTPRQLFQACMDREKASTPITSFNKIWPHSQNLDWNLFRIFQFYEMVTISI